MPARSTISLSTILLLLGLASSILAWGLIAPPVITFASVQKHAGHFPLAYLHVLGGSIMLFVGLANLYIGTARRKFKYHKLVGRIYLIGGGIGAIAAIVIKLGPAHKPASAGIFTNTTISLLTLAIAWLLAAGMAYRAARNKRFDTHRDWMIRSYILAWSFVFCRLAGRVSGVEDMGGGNAFIWLSWVGPLILCEVALQWRAGANSSLKPKPIRGSA